MPLSQASLFSKSTSKEGKYENYLSAVSPYVNETLSYYVKWGKNVLIILANICQVLLCKIHILRSGREVGAPFYG